MVDKGDDGLKHAEQLLREGKKQEALALLVGYVKQHPTSIQGWWQLSFVVPDVKQQIDCVERVLRLDPASTLAQSRLESLRQNASTLPPSVPPFVESDGLEEVSLPPVSQPISTPISRPISQPISRPISTPVSQPISTPLSAAHKQDSKPVPPAPKAKNRTWQYVVLVLIACALLTVIGFAAVILLQNVDSTQQPVNTLSITQISMPPTWTPQPTATRIASLTPYPTITPVILPTLTLEPTGSPVPQSQVGPFNGYYAPNFSLTNIDGNKTASLSDYRGQAVLIFFWATWCPYCKAEMPAVEMVYKAYKDKGFTVLAVDVGESAGLARQYQDAHDITFPILDDPNRSAASAYDVTAFPTYFFVDPSGVISSINIGSVGYWGFDGKVKSMLGLQ